MLLYCAFCGVVIITCGLFGFLTAVVKLCVGVGFGVLNGFREVYFLMYRSYC